MTRSEALLAYCHLCTTEADAAFYAWPRLPETELEQANYLVGEADRAVDAAESEGIPDGAWHRVRRWFAGESL